MGKDFKIEDTDMFKMSVIKEATNPEINVPNEELYDRFVFILKNEFKDITAGEIISHFGARPEINLSDLIQKELKDWKNDFISAIKKLFYLYR